MVEEKTKIEETKPIEILKTEELKEKKKMSSTYKYLIIAFATLAILIICPAAGLFPWIFSILTISFLLLLSLVGAVIFYSRKAKEKEIVENKIASMEVIDKKIDEIMQSDSIADYLIEANTKEHPGVKHYGTSNTPIYMRQGETYWGREKVTILINMMQIDKFALLKSQKKADIKEAAEKLAAVPMVFGKRVERFLTAEGTTHEISEQLPQAAKKNKEDLD